MEPPRAWMERMFGKPAPRRYQLTRLRRSDAPPKPGRPDLTVLFLGFVLTTVCGSIVTFYVQMTLAMLARDAQAAQSNLENTTATYLSMSTRMTDVQRAGAACYVGVAELYGRRVETGKSPFPLRYKHSKHPEAGALKITADAVVANSDIYFGDRVRSQLEAVTTEYRVLCEAVDAGAAGLDAAGWNAIQDAAGRAYSQSRQMDDDMRAVIACKRAAVEQVRLYGTAMPEIHRCEVLKVRR